MRCVSASQTRQPCLDVADSYHQHLYNVPPVHEAMTVSVSGPATPLSEADLIPDRALDSKEDDRFQHAPIAARVADLVISAEPPVNIALFGAWGSGKSSFGSLLKAEVESRRKGVKFITFDAWAYSGEPLQRNFISHVAAALGFDPESDEGRPFSRNTSNLGWSEDPDCVGR